jgi:uncharacterized membrane protein (DUF4010 family)
MDLASAFTALGLALGVGLLIGFERQQSAAAEKVPERASMGGSRTFPLVALAGAVSALVSRSVGTWFTALVFVAVAALVAVSYMHDLRQSKDHGLTSETAMLVAFLLGALAAADGVFESTKERVLVVASVAVVVTFVLSLKPPLHALAGRTTKDDVLAALKFLVVAVVVLPVLPNRGLGPLEAVNPFKLGLLVALMTGVGFAGYVAMRVLGARSGLVLTGVLGGLVSSTAVTLAAAGHAKKSDKAADACATAVTLAGTVMAARTAIVLSAVNAQFLRTLAVPLGAVLLAGVVMSVVQWLRTRGGGKVELKVSNPIDLFAAVKMGLLIGAVLVATKAARQWLGPGGVVATSALAGTFDVDAVSISAAELAGDAASDTATKNAVAAFVGGRRFGRALLLYSAATILAAAAGIAWLHLRQ